MRPETKHRSVSTDRRALIHGSWISKRPVRLCASCIAHTVYTPGAHPCKTIGTIDARHGEAEQRNYLER